MNKPEAPHVEGHVTNFLRNIVEADLARGQIERRHWNGRPGDGTFQAQGPLDRARIRTRFPPEPNGYLHIGHAKSICLNFGLARDYGGRCHLRFDDTNPVKEEQEFVDAIQADVRWLGFDWTDGDEVHLYHASDYFDALYEYAEYLVSIGHAYVDEQSAEEMRLARGTLTEPGRNSPDRDRPVAHHLQRLREMRAGRHPEGSMVLRARIDMASPNINLRDPTLYRIRFATHHRTGDTWCIYPMYDYAHAISDAIENISHSICTLEFEDHRALYDWCVERVAPKMRTPQWNAALEIVAGIERSNANEREAFAMHCATFRHKLFASAEEARMRALFHAWEHGRGAIEGKPSADVVRPDLDYFYELLRTTPEQFAPLLCHALETRRPDPFELPHQYEFNRGNVTYLITSKRKLKQLVDERHVDGWDDPRMPTIAGLRRRGFTPESIRLFWERGGVSRSADSGWVDYALLEQALRDDLDPKVPRAVAVLDPVKLVLVDWPVGHREDCTAPVHPHRPELGRRTFPIARELWIERDDFADPSPKGFFRLAPGNLVRLKYGYVVRCIGAIRDAEGRVVEVRAEVVPDTKSGSPGADAVKVKGNITWIAVEAAERARFLLYDRLFAQPQPESDGHALADSLSPDSLKIANGFVEPGTTANDVTQLQLERYGYFSRASRNAGDGVAEFIRIATLRDSRR